MWASSLAGAPHFYPYRLAPPCPGGAFSCPMPYHLGMVPFAVGTKVRFHEPYRPSQVRWGTLGTVVDVEERPAPNSGFDYWVRARFGNFLTPWIEAWQLERAN
jgi:hypothetical protein